MAKILIIDDSPVDLQNLQSILVDAGHLVTIATSGEDGVAKAKASPPDAIMMDVNMPGLDGFSAARQLMQHATTKGIPVVFVTGKEATVDVDGLVIRGAMRRCALP